MESAQNSTNLVWYNYNPLEGIMTSGTPVHVEISSDTNKQIGLNQPIQIQYGNFSVVQNQPQHIILAPHPQVESTNTELVNVNNSNSQKPSKKQKIRSSVSERIPCTECGKTFSCSANLRDHIRLHTGERPFSCSECGMSFAQRSNWRLHKRVHTGERPYMCGICGKTFSRSSHLPGHMRIHTGERPFNCEMCNSSFGSSQALKNHMRTHTGEKPFVCEYCSTRFTHSSSLSSHRKRCTGSRRKRGRPLGTTVARLKKKTVSGRRGRPKKRIRFIKKEKKIKNDDVLDNKEGESTDLFSVEESDSELPVKFQSSEQPSHSSNEDLGVQMYVAEEMSDIIFPNHSQGVSILPGNNSTIQMEEDMVQVAANAAGLNETVDLHQEAAVTMAALQHSTVNAIPHHEGKLESSAASISHSISSE